MINQKQTVFLLITLCFTNFSYSSQQHRSFRDALLANAPTHRQVLLEKQKNLMKILEGLKDQGKKKAKSSTQ